MKLYIKRACLMLTILASASAIHAQSSYSGYFLDDYNYKFTMNPAAGNDHNFVSMPGLGNLNASLRGNLDLSDIIYPYNGRTVLFSNPNISTENLMRRLDANNEINANIKETILSAGFKAFGGYNTVSINTVANVSANLPRSLFSLAKEGVYNTTYDISGIDAQANAYAELALNHSRDIKSVPGLRVGAAVKFLLGYGDIDADVNRADVTLGYNEWTATTNANVYTSVQGVNYTHDVNSNTGHTYVDGYDFDTFKFNGLGLAFDLGAEYKFNDWKFSAAVNDLGFIHWNKTYLASTNGDQTVNSDSYIFSANEDASNYAKDEARRLRDDLTALYELNDEGEVGGRTTGLAATLNLGAEYELPVYRKLRFGLLSTTRINGQYSWTEARLSANIHPVKVFSANANFVCNSFTYGFGWLANLHLTGFNLFAGMDQTLGKLEKHGAPLKSRAQVNVGINFPF
jgi:hypothetical protein